jgi:hypothetical protein
MSKDVVVKDSAVLARKAYGDAMSVLRENHRDEFDGLLDASYTALGVESPRVRRSVKKAAVEAERAEKAVAREARRVAKIAKLQAELDSLVSPVSDPADPVF